LPEAFVPAVDGIALATDAARSTDRDGTAVDRVSADLVDQQSLGGARAMAWRVSRFA
jgi:hypothetical protein